MLGRLTSPKRAALGLGLAGALALGIAVPAVAFAEDPTPSSSSPATTSPGEWGRGRPDRGEMRAARQAALAEALAKELGISQEKVTAALEKVQPRLAEQARAERLNQMRTRLDQAVTDGKLTREQADAILKAAEAGVLPGGMGHGRGPGFGR